MGKVIEFPKKFQDNTDETLEARIVRIKASLLRIQELVNEIKREQKEQNYE